MPPSVLLVLVNEHLLKDNLALEFVLEVFATLKAERGVASLVTALKKGQLEGRSVTTVGTPTLQDLTRSRFTILRPK